MSKPPHTTDLESRRPPHKKVGKGDSAFLWEAGNGGKPIEHLSKQASNPQQAAVAEPPEETAPSPPLAPFPSKPGQRETSLGGAVCRSVGRLGKGENEGERDSLT